jgi:hypothetical protein
MTEADDRVRTAIRELADEGEPVDVGRAVLARLDRRRRRLRAGAVAVASVAVAAALVVPQLIASNRDSGGTDAPPSATSPGDRPLFAGIPGVAAAAGAPSGRLVVAAYGTEAGVSYLLDPRSGDYRRLPVQGVLAVSPDLRWALAARSVLVTDAAGSGPLDARQYGFYDATTGDAAGWLDLDKDVDPRSGTEVGQASWSPDGRTVALAVRRGVAGQGWITEQVALVDVRSGAVAMTTVGPAAGLEPVDLLGWTRDSSGIVLTADRVGTDQAPSGHLVYGRDGTLIASIRWKSQGYALLSAGLDLVAVTAIDSNQVTLIDTMSGANRASYTGQRLTSSDKVVGWRDAEAIVRSQQCGASGCTDGPVLSGIDLDTGIRKPLRILPTEAQRIVISSADSLTDQFRGMSW